MPVRFIPASIRFQQVALAEWTRSSWDTDQATVLFRGPRTDADRYLDTVQRFEVMPSYPRMYLVNAQRKNITPNFPGVEKNYIGFRDGTVPKVKRVNDNSSQTVTGQGTDNAPSSPTFGKQVSGQVCYISPQTTYTWYETSNPANTPRYSTIDGKRGIQITQVSVQPVTLDDGTIARPTFSAFTAIINSLALEDVVSDYECEELVQGILWGCRSIVQLRIVST